MSRFIEALNRVARAAPQPMGFRASQPAPSGSRMLLIASLARAEGIDRLAEYADAVLLRLAKSGPAAKAMQNAAGALPDKPWGVWLEDAGARKIEALVEAGCDFVVLTPASRVAAAPRGDKVGRIIQLALSLDDGLLRAVNELPAEAALAADTYEGGAMTWHHLMLIQHLSNMLTKPLLVPVPPEATADELRALWEAGVDGIVVEADGVPPERLRELRRAIGDLPPRANRKRGKIEALLPGIGGAKTTAPEEEDDGEEDDE